MVETKCVHCSMVTELEPHAEDCPFVTDLWPVVEAEFGGGLSCGLCLFPLSDGDFYVQVPWSEGCSLDEGWMIVCVGCGALIDSELARPPWWDDDEGDDVEGCGVVAAKPWQGAVFEPHEAHVAATQGARAERKAFRALASPQEIARRWVVVAAGRVWSVLVTPRMERLLLVAVLVAGMWLAAGRR